MKQGVESSNGERNSVKELFTGILSKSVLRHLLGQKAVCLSREVRIPYGVLTSLGEVGLDSQPLEAIVLPAGRTAFWHRCVNRRDSLFLWKKTPKVLITPSLTFFLAAQISRPRHCRSRGGLFPNLQEIGLAARTH